MLSYKSNSSLISDMRARKACCNAEIRFSEASRNLRTSYYCLARHLRDGASRDDMARY